MNNPYTADDFARADFARHPDGGLAMRVRPLDVRPWETGRCYASDATMALTGWVPVPHGSYTRHDSPDYADGGMAAAAIEKEIEDRPSNLIAAYWMREYDRRDEDAKRWKEVARRAIQDQAGLRHELVLADERAEKHRRAEVDHSTNARCWMKTSEEWQATAEEWEEKCVRRGERITDLVQERDEAIAFMTEAQEEATRQAVRADTAERHDCIRDAAVIRELRPLTPGDITEEMVKRAQREYPLSPRTVRDMLTAALTTPARPEGAEEIERLIRHAEGGGWLDDPKLLADYIASSGVRVEGSER